MEAQPRIIKETPVSALVDGDGGLGHVPAHFAMQVAIDKAKQSGMAVVAVRNSAHFGATGYYTLMAAKEGLIGMASKSASSIHWPRDVPEFEVYNGPYHYTSTVWQRERGAIDDC